MAFYGSVLTLKYREILSVIMTAKVPCLSMFLYIVLIKLKPMKTRIICFVLLIVLFASCVRALTPDQAANGSYKKCHPMR